MDGSHDIECWPEGSSVDDPNRLREFAIERIDDVFRRGLRIVLAAKHPGHVLAYFMLALGWYDEIGGVDNAALLARKLGVTKANANKYENLFCDILPTGIGRMDRKANQRSEKSRTCMTTRRIAQCK